MGILVLPVHVQSIHIPIGNDDDVDEQNRRREKKKKKRSGNFKIERQRVVKEEKKKRRKKCLFRSSTELNSTLPLSSFIRIGKQNKKFCCQHRSKIVRYSLYISLILSLNNFFPLIFIFLLSKCVCEYMCVFYT